MKLIRNIWFVGLAVAYLAVSCATVLQMLGSSYTSSGPPALAMHNGKTKDPPRPSFTPRRHIPLVKPVTLALDAACIFEPSVVPPEYMFHQRLARCSTDLQFSLFSSQSDRAPPVI